MDAARGEWTELPHTADVGVRVCAAGLPELFQTAATAMYACAGEYFPSADAPAETVRVVLTAPGLAELLRDWLAELLYHLDVTHRIAADIEIESVAATRLAATVVLVRYDEHRSTPRRELKAVTYHGLSVSQAEGRCVAEVIFDI